MADGNIATMREAIMAIKSVNDGRPHDAAGYEINDIIEEALAAPPRNCDRFNTASEAHIAFQRFCRGNYRPGLAASGLDGCDDCELCETKNMSGEDSCPFFWLFGTEGGAE